MEFQRHLNVIAVCFEMLEKHRVYNLHTKNNKVVPFIITKNFKFLRSAKMNQHCEGQRPSLGTQPEFLQPFPLPVQANIH